jgi:hypothetical protein
VPKHAEKKLQTHTIVEMGLLFYPKYSLLRILLEIVEQLDVVE